MSGRNGCAGCVPITWGSPRFVDRSVGPFQITDAWFPAGARLEPHLHDRPVVAITLDGRIESKLAGRALTGCRDDVWTEPVGEIHSNRVGDDGARVLVVQPDPSADRILEACHTLLEGVHHFRSGAAGHEARKIVASLGGSSDLDDLLMEGLVLQLLSMGTRQSLRSSRPESHVDRALELVHDRFLDRLSVSDIAAEVGLHPSYLARAFKARTGVTVGARLRALRLDWAAHRLRTTDEPIGRIALRARFSDQSHFTRAFRRHTGSTPRRFRLSR